MNVYVDKTKPCIKRLNDFYESQYARFFLSVAHYIRKRNGTLEDAKDVFHDALIIYYEKLQRSDFNEYADEGAYLMGIVKNKWAQKVKYNSLATSLPAGADPIDGFEEAIDVRRLYKIVVTAGEKCLDLLRAFYSENISLKEIADLFGFRGVHSAAVQKYKCLEKIRETIRQNSLRHEDFFE